MAHHIQVSPQQLRQLLDCIDLAADNRETALAVLRAYYPDHHPQVVTTQAELDAYYELAAHVLLHRTGTDPSTATHPN